MQKRKLGKQGLEVPALGLGCMGMSWAYGKGDETESIRVLHRALEMGMNFWDTAELYGPYANEELLGRALKDQSREEIIIATKFGFAPDSQGELSQLNSSPAHIKKSIEGSLKRLGTDYIDLYYQHRLDPNTPIEETVGAMAELVQAGKVKYLGLSEVSSETLHRANLIYPISVLQSEYSMWERNVEETILPAVRELGIGFVAYSPIGRGFLTGKIKSVDQLDESDRRRAHPRFQGENILHNMQLVDVLDAIAETHSVTPAQIAIAWVLRQGHDIVPIPGTKQVKYLEENAEAVTLNLPDAVWNLIDETLASFQTAGIRYPQSVMRTIDGR